MIKILKITEKSFRALCRQVGLEAQWESPAGTVTVTGYFDDEVQNSDLSAIGSAASDRSFTALFIDMPGADKDQALTIAGEKYKVTTQPQLDSSTGLIELRLGLYTEVDDDVASHV